jgi:hypothetical protein
MPRRKPGRPPLPRGTARSCTVQARVTAAEHAAFSQLAAREGLTESEAGQAAVQLALARGSLR